jgi:hypothetical protein
MSGQMVLEKDSSILGYPGEISRPLDADHHGVCKFATAEDTNYKSILAALQSLVRQYCNPRMHRVWIYSRGIFV